MNMNEQTGQPGRTGQTGRPSCRGGPVSPGSLGNRAESLGSSASPKIVLPHGGYKKLIVYRKSDVIYQGTVLFCRRFLPAHGDRTVDQMTQAARSCKQNIAEEIGRAHV